MPSNYTSGGKWDVTDVHIGAVITISTSPRWSAAIGQIVEFDRSIPLILRPKGSYEVVSILRGDKAISPTYRVKSNAEPFARGAR